MQEFGPERYDEDYDDGYPPGPFIVGNVVFRD